METFPFFNVFHFCSGQWTLPGPFFLVFWGFDVFAFFFAFSMCYFFMFSFFNVFFFIFSIFSCYSCFDFVLCLCIFVSTMFFFTFFFLHNTFSCLSILDGANPNPKLVPSLGFGGVTTLPNPPSPSLPSNRCRRQHAPVNVGHPSTPI